MGVRLWPKAVTHVAPTSVSFGENRRSSTNHGGINRSNQRHRNIRFNNGACPGQYGSMGDGRTMPGHEVGELTVKVEVLGYRILAGYQSE